LLVLDWDRWGIHHDAQAVMNDALAEVLYVLGFAVCRWLWRCIVRDRPPRVKRRGQTGELYGPDPAAGRPGEGRKNSSQTAPRSRDTLHGFSISWAPPAPATHGRRTWATGLPSPTWATRTRNLGVGGTEADPACSSAITYARPIPAARPDPVTPPPRDP
jgi:hypothetical protein